MASSSQVALPRGLPRLRKLHRPISGQGLQKDLTGGREPRISSDAVKSPSEMNSERTTFAEKRRILQLETLYDLAVTLNAHRQEQDLVDELLQRVCAVLDPGAAVAVTRDYFGAPRSVASVGWSDSPPDASGLLEAPLWKRAPG